MTIKERRKALGWDRGTLARRAGIDKAVTQLIERGEWNEPSMIACVEEVLERAEGGELDVQLPTWQPPQD